MAIGLKVAQTGTCGEKDETYCAEWGSSSWSQYCRWSRISPSARQILSLKRNKEKIPLKLI